LILDSGMTGCLCIAAMRTVSSVVYSTVRNRFSSVLRRTHGSCAEKYRFAAPSTDQMASSARCIAVLSKWPRTRSSSPSAAASSSSSSAVNSTGSGTIPSRFLATIDSERCARLPSSLARSALIRPMIASSL
jgi:hypothetical protein